MALDRNNLKKYLLGDASEAESEQVGVRMIEDESFAGEISLAEGELIEDYLEGSLTERERELFEKHYLVNEERRDLVNEVALLKRYSSGSIPVYNLDPKPKWTDRFFGLRPWATMSAAAMVLLIALAGWQLFLAPSGSSLERQYAELNRADLIDIGRYPSMQVSPGAFRNSGTETRFKIEGPGESFMFRLPLLFTPEQGTEFHAVLNVAGKQAFTVESARMYKTGNTNEVRVVFPRSVFVKGQCQISLTPKTGGAPIVYSFNAE